MKGKKHEGRRMELENGQGSEGKEKYTGWQADGCSVYWFIRWFSHDVPAMKQAGDSPCVREYQTTRLQLFFLLKRIRELLTRVVYFSQIPCIYDKFVYYT